jgi:protein-S-isoprenylcysteine O-methyltransferase Ste14
MPAKDIMFVLVQFFLLVLFALLPGFSYTSGFWQQTFAFVLVVAGLSVTASALYTLGYSLSPFPTPRSGARLITSGAFRYVRHPIYTGIIFILGGISIYTMHIPRLLVTACLLVLFRFKSAYEETLLTKRYPGYEAYAKRVGRFLPRWNTLRKLFHF